MTDLIKAYREDTLVHWCGGHVTRFETIQRTNTVTGKKEGAIYEGIMCMNCGKFVIRQKDDKTSEWQDIVIEYHKEQEKMCENDLNIMIDKALKEE
jgi:hypothetical protein